jgi:hypothetical protein
MRLTFYPFLPAATIAITDPSAYFRLVAGSDSISRATKEERRHRHRALTNSSFSRFDSRFEEIKLIWPIRKERP